MYRYLLAFAYIAVAIGCSTPAKDKPAKDPQTESEKPVNNDTAPARKLSVGPRVGDVGAPPPPPPTPAELAAAKQAEAARIKAEQDKVANADIPAMLARAHSVVHGTMNIDPGFPMLHKIKVGQVLAGATPTEDTRVVFASGATPRTLDLIEPWVYFIRELDPTKCDALSGAADKPAAGGSPEAAVGLNVCGNFKVWEVARASDRLMPGPKLLERIQAASAKQP